MTVIVVPSLLLWILIATMAVNAAATAYQIYLVRRLPEAPKP